MQHLSCWEWTAWDAERWLGNFCKRFQSAHTRTVVTLMAELARLQPERYEYLEGFFIKRQELLKNLQKTGSSFRDPIQRFEPELSAMMFKKLFIQEEINTAKKFHIALERAEKLPQDNRDAKDNVNQCTSVNSRTAWNGCE